MTDKVWLRVGVLGLVAALGGALSCREAAAESIRPASSPTEIKAGLAAPPPQIAAPTVAPVSLTGSDGSGLELISVTANAVIEDPLAFTELKLVFKNPESRVREGRFRITLPVGATISRFAMRIGDRLQEGEVVEQQAARVAYEDFLHRRQDPALLESEAGNEFSARVFPIAANETKELIVSYSQQLTRRDEPYTLPLRGLPKLGTLSVRAMVRKDGSGGTASNMGGQRVQHEVVQLDKHDFMPDRDFEIAHDGAAGRLGLRHENLVAARVTPLAENGARDPLASLFVLFDTSASRALGLEQQLSELDALLYELGKSADMPIQVAAFDQTISSIYDGKLSQRGDSIRRAVQSRRALGASDLDGALGWLAEALKKQKHTRVLLVSDGVATAGDSAAEKLQARVKALAALGVERFDVLAASGIRDDVLLTRMVTSGLKRDGVVLDARRPAALLSQKLTRGTRSGLKVEVEGAGWVWPSTLNGVQPGDEVVVYADLPGDRALNLKVDGKPLALAGSLSKVERPLLERAWVKARIDRLIEQRDASAANDRDLADALKKQATELSTKYRVLSPFTSLLVLETEQDYARFGIERRALADILTVDASGISLLHRADFAPRPVTQMATGEGVARDKAAIAAPPAPTALAEPERNESFGETMKDEAEMPSTRGGMPASAPAPSMGSGYGGGGGSLGQARARASQAAAASEGAPVPRERLEDDSSPREEARRESPARPPEAAKKGGSAPVEGELKVVLDLIQRGDKQGALSKALAWRARDAGDILALVALGEAWEALNDQTSAERAYGSIIDLFPGRADMRRFAGERLERVRTASALKLAIDTYRKSVEQRPDHPASHRLLGFALLKQNQPRAAFEAILAGVQRHYPDGRFRGVDRILREDLGLAAAVWSKAEPALADEIRTKLTNAGGNLENAPSMRFVLNWETDANDVDFHIEDGHGGHAYYSEPRLKSGGDLYADVTTGYGPECFTIRGAKRAYPYKLQAHYYSKGPMGYGMGKLEVIDHDGKGGLRFEERPFVVMQDGAFVELGNVRAPSAVIAK